MFLPMLALGTSRLVNNTFKHPPEGRLIQRISFHAQDIRDYLFFPLGIEDGKLVPGLVPAYLERTIRSLVQEPGDLGIQFIDSSTPLLYFFHENPSSPLTPANLQNKPVEPSPCQDQTVPTSDNTQILPRAAHGLQTRSGQELGLHVFRDECR